MTGTWVEPATDDGRQRAVCRDEEPELFFPIGTSGPARVQIATAEPVCAPCPVSGCCPPLALGRRS
jgi:WhiB family transcriptional regulator, redox-sensing transcriptional regulator